MKKNLPLIVGISLPIIFIIIISFIVFLPNTFVKPAHNFLYQGESVNYSNYRNEYGVENGQIVVKPVPHINEMILKDPYFAQSLTDLPPIYFYDVEKDSSYEISLDEARGYELSAGPSSPDGYSVIYDYSHNGIFEIFGSYDNNSGYFISSSNGGKKKINGIKGNRYYGDLKIIGWIK